MRRFLPVLAVFLLLFTAAGCTSDDSPAALSDPNDPITAGGDDAAGFSWMLRARDGDGVC